MANRSTCACHRAMPSVGRGTVTAIRHAANPSISSVMTGIDGNMSRDIGNLTVITTHMMAIAAGMITAIIMVMTAIKVPA